VSFFPVLFLKLPVARALSCPFGNVRAHLPLIAAQGRKPARDRNISIAVQPADAQQ
jgi:hypothetical protein